MSKIQSGFKCMICSQELKFPNNIDIAEFIILQLQFYKVHEMCEKAEGLKPKQGRKKK